MANPKELTRNHRLLQAYMADISTAGSAFIPCPCEGKVVKWYSSIYNAITGADCGLSLEINGTAVTGSALTVTQSGSAAGDVDSAVPTAANVVKPGDTLEVVSDGASSTTTPAMFTIIIRETGAP